MCLDGEEKFYETKASPLNSHIRSYVVELSLVGLAIRLLSVIIGRCSLIGNDILYAQGPC